MIKTYFYDADQKRIIHDVDLRRPDLLANSRSLLWVDLYDFTEAEINEVASIFGFHTLSVEDCLHYSPRAKVDDYEDYFFFLLHAIRYEEDKEEEVSLEQLNVYLGNNFIVTLHRRTLRTLGRLARECLSNQALFMQKGPDFFLYTILDGLTDHYFPVLERINARIDELEDDLYVEPSKEITEEFLSLKRTILAMRRAIMPQKRIFTMNNGQYSFAVSEENAPYYLDLLDHIERIIDSIDGFAALVDNAMATYYSIISARTNETMRVLTVISTIFMPLTFVTGFFGMNVPLPAQDNAISTISITLGLLGVSLWMYLIFRVKKWI
ncbi:MAG: magnesium/cobalt transporter CorA [Bacillota bacterium]|uniref:magnesium/cobalt transporter CorA n=1 Tax=Desulfurispora thermophila TaxID=265470 RepID=UPI00037DD2E4|nr:magnesium/cobalt transporter CorA [Desulfurispora thermophila]